MDWDELAFGLILLQEICQGYGTPEYRGRALRHLIASRNRLIGDFYVQRWFHHAITTQECIQLIEKGLEGGSIA